MKALSIKQPWAWLICKRIKSIENRNWPSKYRGPLIIHAGKLFDYEGYEWIIEHFGNIFKPGAINIPNVGKYFSKGVLIGRVEMIDCVKEYDSPWFFGPYGFVFKDAIEFKEPIPYKGQLGIFNVDLHIK